MKVLLIALLATVSAKPTPDGVDPSKPSSSYGVPSGARLSDGRIDSGFFSVPTSTFGPFFGGASSQFQAPVFGASDFNAVDGAAAFRLQTESPAVRFGNFGNPVGASFESSTASPLGVAGYSGSFGDGLSSVSTAAPFGFSDVTSSTFAPELSGFGSFGGFPAGGFAQGYSSTPASVEGVSVTPTSNSGAVSGDFGAVFKTAGELASQAPEVQRSLYFFSAPEDEEIIQQRISVPAPAPQKRYKVIFIKAPSYNNRRLIEIPGQQTEEKTLVYVLVKKPEDNTDVNVQPSQTLSARPEVFFVKYKTKEEAEEAVNKINAGVHTASVTANPTGTTEFLNSIRNGAESTTTVNGVRVAGGGAVNGFQTSTTPVPISFDQSGGSGGFPGFPNFPSSFPSFPSNGINFGEFPGQFGIQGFPSFPGFPPASGGSPPAFSKIQTSTVSPVNSFGSFQSTPSTLSFPSNFGGSFGYSGGFPFAAYNAPGFAQGRSVIQSQGNGVAAITPQPAAVVSNPGNPAEAVTQAAITQDAETTVNIGGNTLSSSTTSTEPSPLDEDNAESKKKK